MIRETKQDVLMYLKFLENQGFRVTIHIRNQDFFNKYFDQLINFNFKDNSFCFALKCDDNISKQCSHCEERVYEKLNSSGAFFGMCHGGVESFSFPIKHNGIVGYINAGEYGIHRDEAKQKIIRMCKNSRLNVNTVMDIYDAGLLKEAVDFQYVQTLIKPLCHMISKLYEIFLRNEDFNEGIDVYAIALSYIRHHYHNNLTLEKIAKICKCSPSTLSHTFKKRNGNSLKSYINILRLNEAKSLLTDTSMSVSSIAEMVGFSDSNYFTNLFKREFNCSPSDYRKNTAEI